MAELKLFNGIVHIVENNNFGFKAREEKVHTMNVRW